METIRLISWETVRVDCKFPITDNNDGFIFGIEYVLNEETIDCEWFKTEEERTESIKINKLVIL